MLDVYTGTVRWFNASKGYGFIGKVAETDNWPNNGDKDIFAHYSGIQASGYKKLEEGETVQFSVETNERSKRLQAVNITRADNEVTA